MSRFGFREWLIDEETDWDALKKAISAGIDAYHKETEEKPKKEKKSKKLKDQVLAAKDKKELEQAVDEIMTSGYTLHPWGVNKKPSEDLHKWILEWIAVTS